MDSELGATAGRGSSGSRHIAVLSLSALGDLLLTLPLLQALRRAHPGAALTIVAERGATAAFARELEASERVVLLPPGARRAPLALARALLVVRGLRADLAVQTFASHGAFGNLLMGATRAGVRVGFDDGRFANRLTHRIPIDDRLHYVTLNLNLLRRLGHVDVAEPEGRYLPPLEERAAAFPLHGLRGRFGEYVVVSPGSDPALAFKRWPAPKWVALCRWLAAQGRTPVFVGDRRERAAIDTILSLGAPGENTAGETGFADLAALVSRSALVVGTDGMVLHLAAAMDRPCVGVFGPTNPLWGGPWRQGHRVVRLGLPCSPCYRASNIGRAMECRTQECLHYLSEEVVIAAVRRALDDAPDASSAGTGSHAYPEPR